MKKQDIQRKNAFKRQTSQQTKKFKGKKSQSISPIQKSINLNVNHFNKQNYNPNIKEQYPYDKPKKDYYEIKHQSNQRQIAKFKNFIPPTEKPMKQIKQINVIVNKSLQKCQLYHPSHTPKSVYLVNSNNQQFVCCQDCGKKFSNKTQIKKIKEKQLGGKKIGQYIQKLSQNLKKLSIFEINAKNYLVRYKQYADLEKRKHLKYYNQILQVIEQAMKKSQTILSNKVKQVQQLFEQKILTLSNEKERIKNMLYSLSNLMYSQSNFYEYKQLVVLTNLSQNDHCLYLPFLSLNINNKLIQDFKNSFNKKYVINIINQKQVPQKQKINRQIFDDYYSKNSSDYYTQNQVNSKSHSKLNNMIYSYNNSYDDTQLYCDQALGPSVSSVNNFSFQGENQIKQPIIPIIQLTEQQDIISPNFKQF